MLAGIRASGQNDDVYLFLDSDITINLNHIKKLVQPLVVGEVHSVSGFQWNILGKKTTGEKLYSFIIGLQAHGYVYAPVEYSLGRCPCNQKERF